jgi:tripartite-type tricarboxylate transporter receptor subunit TctC
MRALLFAVAFAATLQGMGSATAQNWPTRPVTMVVPFAAGGTADVAARILGGRLSEILRQSVVIENIGGAGGMIGIARVGKAQPDGYQFVLGGIDTFAQNQTLYKKLPYNAVTDFAPVALIADWTLVLVTRKDLPVSNLTEFIAFAKANEAMMKYGSAGTGSAVHLACALLNAAIGINITHVPYRNSGTGVQDMIAGRIDYWCLTAGTAVPQIESKLLKAIAVLTRNRSPILPDLASAHEQGLAEFEAYLWHAFFLPKRTPAAIIQKLHNATIEAMDTPTVLARLKELGGTLVARERRSPEYLQKFLEREIEKWAGVIKASGVSMD